MAYPKIIDSPNYHIWSDALHARALAEQAENEWDRGTYVRWTVISVWTALEMMIEETVGTAGIGRRFRENLDSAIARAGLVPLQWGHGIWQRVLALHDDRVRFVHLNDDNEALFPKKSVASDSLGVVREAIRALALHVGKAPPPWIVDDVDRGWAGRRGTRGSAHLTTCRGGIDPEGADTIRIAFVQRGAEYFIEYLHPEEDVESAINAFLSITIEPVSHIRIYRGPTLIEERPLKMRGVPV